MTPLFAQAKSTAISEGAIAPVGFMMEADLDEGVRSYAAQVSPDPALFLARVVLGLSLRRLLLVPLRSPWNRRPFLPLPGPRDRLSLSTATQHHRCLGHCSVCTRAAWLSRPRV